MKERQHFLMESRLLLQTMGLWYWNLWARTAFLLCDFAIHKTIYFSRYFFMLKSTSTTHLLFSPIILVEHTFSKRLWASSFLTCKGRKWNGNILLCSERKIYLFSHFCSSSHFLDKDNYYVYVVEDYHKNPVHLCYCLSSSTKTECWRSGQNWYLSVDLRALRSSCFLHNR